VNTDCGEENLNDKALEIFGRRLAPPDFTGRPYQDQEFRCYQDLSDDDKILITFRLRDPKKLLTMRVSSRTDQEAIEIAASEAWGMHVEFGTKFCQSLNPMGAT
jgi:hypothetical protein